jgi:Fe-S cluster biogenesis protein NfuA
VKNPENSHYSNNNLILSPGCRVAPPNPKKRRFLNDYSLYYNTDLLAKPPFIRYTLGMSGQKKKPPSASKKQIERILTERVNPILAEHYGAAQLTGFEDGVVTVRLTGACGSCPSAQYTIEDVVKAEICAGLPGVRDVVLDTAVSQDLIDMARKILNKEV